MLCVPNPKFATLMFRSAASVDACGQPHRIAWEDYYSVLHYPAREVGNDPEAIASEFVSLTYTPAWRWALRRRLCAGDLLILPPAAYMFSNPNLPLPVSEHQPIVLHKWRHLVLVQFELQGLPTCTVST